MQFAIHHSSPKSFQSCTVTKHPWCGTKYMTTTFLDRAARKKQHFYKNGKIYYMGATICNLLFAKHTVVNRKKPCKICGFHGSDYEECHLLVYKTPVCTSQGTHYVSVTESSQLMLCKICGFHSSDYEECRLLGYKTPVRTSQGTHYDSTTESSQVMLCKMWGFHGGDYEEWCLLGCYTVWFLQEPQGITSQKTPFFRKKPLPSSVSALFPE
jgi:hypothetical protein